VAVSAQRPCVFLHGAGLLTDSPPTSTFPDYWGDVNDYTPQCTSWTFNHADTTTRTFDNTTLMQMYCDVASGGTGVINNTIVFTHSMANNILAAAIRDGMCTMEASTSWYLSSPPTQGSKAGDMCEEICNSTNWLDGPLRDLLVLFHYCVNDQPGDANMAWYSMQTTYPGLQGLPAVMSAYASGAMCGDSAIGLVSIYSLGLEALAAIVDYGELNDGMVPLSSCQAGLDPSLFTGEATSNWYLGGLNHADTTCRNGNGDFGADRQPCSWFGDRS